MAKDRAGNTNTYLSNIREFLPVDILNGILKMGDINKINDMCKDNTKDFDTLKTSYENIKEFLTSKKVSKQVIDGMHYYRNTKRVGDLESVISSVLKGIRTALDVQKYAEKHPFAKVNKFSGFYKAYVINNDSEKKKLMGKSSDKLNPSDIILVYNNGAPEFLLRDPNASGEIKGKYVIGVSLKSTEKKTKSTGFKNPGAIPFAKVVMSQLGGGGEYPDYTKGKASKFIKDLGAYVKNAREQIKEIASDPNNEFSLDTKGKLTKSSTDSAYRNYYRTPSNEFPAVNSFAVLAQTIGRGVQATLRDQLVDIYAECTKSKEGQSALMDHIFDYWFGINKMYPPYFVYEFKGSGINSYNDSGLTPYVFYWTREGLSKTMGNGRFKVVKKALDSFEINTENGTNVFSCRFKWGRGLGISSMKMGASSAFGEPIVGTLENVNKPEYNVPFDPTFKINTPSELKKLMKGCEQLVGMGNIDKINESRLYESYFLSYFGADKHTINESKTTNTHIEHMEDMLFNGGVSGTREAINVARYVRDVLSGKVSPKNVSMKWDGRVSIVVGRDPSDNKFFVAKKSAFNKNPIVYKSISEINQADLPTDLKRTFIDMYRYLDHNVAGIYQGDLLFTKDSKKKTVIDGVKGISFHPNTIVYFIPQDSIDLYDEIDRAKIGIAWHTAYTGTSLDNLQAKASDDIAPLFASKDVYSIGSGIKDGQNFNLSEKDKGDIDKQLTEIGKLFQKMNPSILNDIKETEQLKSLMKAFYNSKVKQNSSVGDIKKYVKELIEFINEKYQGMIDKLKTASAKERREIEKESVLSYFTKYSASEIEDVFRLFQLLSNIKNTLLRHLNRVGNMNTFIRTNEGYRVTNQEGFVVANEEGNVIKLVDRLEFSKNNFSPDVIKGWTR